MTIPLWTLLGFAAWTLLLLMATVGVYRWFNILFRKAPIASFRSDQLEGEDWYRRGTRAHANCVENLPVFGAIVFVISAIGVEGPCRELLVHGGPGRARLPVHGPRVPCADRCVRGRPVLVLYAFSWSAFWRSS